MAILPALTLDLRVHHDFDPATMLALQSITRQLAQLLLQGETMSLQLDNLSAEVARDKTVNESAVTLLQGLAQQIADLKTDPVALQALSDALKAQSDSLAAAVSANTTSNATTGGGDPV